MFLHWMHCVVGVKSNTGRTCANSHVSACGIGAPPVRVHSRQVVGVVADADAVAGVVAVAIMTPSVEDSN